MSTDSYTRPENFVPAAPSIGPTVEDLRQPPALPTYNNRAERREAGERGPISDRRAKILGWTTVGTVAVGGGFAILAAFGPMVLLVSAAGTLVGGVGVAGGVNAAKRWVRNPTLGRSRSGGGLGFGFGRSRGRSGLGLGIGGSRSTGRSGGLLGSLRRGAASKTAARGGVLNRAAAAHTAKRRGLSPSPSSGVGRKRRSSSASTPGSSPRRRSQIAGAVKAAMHGKGPLAKYLPSRPSKKPGGKSGGSSASRINKKLEAAAAKRAKRPTTVAGGLRRTALHHLGSHRPFRAAGWGIAAVGVGASRLLWEFIAASLGMRPADAGLEKAKKKTKKGKPEAVTPPAEPSKPAPPAEPSKPAPPAEPSKLVEPAKPADPDSRDTEPDSDRPRRRPATPPTVEKKPTEDLVAQKDDQQKNMKRWGIFPPHDAQSPMVKAHAEMFGAKPLGPLHCLNHFKALSNLYVRGGNLILAQADYFVAVAPDTDLVHEMMKSLARAFGDAGRAAMAAARAYQIANEQDIRNAERPRANEAFNNVPGRNRGQDLYPLRKNFEEAMMVCFSWEPTGDSKPTELLAFLEGLYPTFRIMGTQAYEARILGFPGVGTAIPNFVHALAHTYQDMAHAAAVTADVYRVDAAHTLNRHMAPRPDEHMANAV